MEEEMTTTQAAPKDKTATPARANGHAETTPEAPALPIDLATLPDDVLAALAAEAPREIARRAKEREEAFLKDMREKAQTLGLTPARLAAALRSAQGKDGRSTVLRKYWCPTDHTLRWSGRGDKPKWYQEHLDRGGTRKDCLIPEGET
jgi:DNA-binding protein H-NS